MKFMAQAFSTIDTNAASAKDPALYNYCKSFPNSTNTGPNLQIKQYGSNAVVIKANHFDYSAETTRDFALLVCDKVDTPVWKTIAVATQDTNDG